MGIKQPPNYVHPNKKKKEEKPNVDLMHERAALKPQSVAPVKRNKVSKPSKSFQTQSSEMILIRLVAKPPLPGQIKIYDDMVAGGLSSKQAILGLFKREFPKFVSDMLANKIGKENDVAVENSYAVETTRGVDIKFIEKARSVFDPFGVLSDRALGQRIGEAIIFRSRKDEQHD